MQTKEEIRPSFKNENLITYLEKKKLTPSELEQAGKDTELLLGWGLPMLGIAFIIMLILIIRKLRE